MEVVISSPVGGAAYSDVNYVSLWAAEGQMGVLPNHADLIAAIQPGKVSIQSAGGNIDGVAGSGFVRIEDGNLHISAEQWTATPSDVDVATRLAEIDDALAGDIGEATAAKLKREQAFLKACSS